MQAISISELEAMRAAARSTMFDTCRIARYGGTGAPDGPEPNIAAFTLGADTDCGFDGDTSGETDGAQETIASATIRLPFGTTIGAQDAILLTKRHGEALAVPEEYRVVGAPRVGTVAVVVKCEKADGLLNQTIAE